MPACHSSPSFSQSKPVHHLHFAIDIDKFLAIRFDNIARNSSISIRNWGSLFSYELLRPCTSFSQSLDRFHRVNEAESGSARTIDDGSTSLKIDDGIVESSMMFFRTMYYLFIYKFIVTSCISIILSSHLILKITTAPYFKFIISSSQSKFYNSSLL